MHMQCHHLKSTRTVEKDDYSLRQDKFSNVQTCKWSSHSSPSVLRPSPVTSQTFPPVFLPSCNKHSHNTANPQKPSTPPCLEKKNSPVSSPTRKRPRTQGQVTSRGLGEWWWSCGEDPPESLSAPSAAHRHTNRQKDHAPVCECVCMCVCTRQAPGSRFTDSRPAPPSPPSPVLLPSSLSQNLPCSPRLCCVARRHPASGEPQQEQGLCHGGQ